MDNSLMFFAAIKVKLNHLMFIIILIYLKSLYVLHVLLYEQVFVK